jgi:hypothetical protein
VARVNVVELQWWIKKIRYYLLAVAYPGIFFGGWGGSTNSAEDRGQREWGSGGSNPLVRGFTQFVNERNPYSD